MPAELSMGSRIEMRISRRPGGALTRAEFTCPCGWSVVSLAPQAWTPRTVRDHARVCREARHEPVPFAGIGGAL